VATKHAKYFAYKTSGNVIPNRLEFPSSDRINIENYDDKIKHILQSADLENSYETHKMIMNGISYKVGHFVFLTHAESELILGQIRTILIKNDTPYLLLERYNSRHCYVTGCLKIVSDFLENDYCIKQIEN
jgi:hypothetical protein